MPDLAWSFRQIFFHALRGCQNVLVSRAEGEVIAGA